MFCTSCGLKNAEDSNFCKQCGQKLEKLLPARITEADFERAMPEEEQVTALLERAYRARKEGALETAIAYCKDALQLRPESTSAHSLLGQLYEQSGDQAQAIREYEQVLALNPGSIADRVKLDELRGDAPTAYPQRRAASQIVIAERQNQQGRPDFRLPATVAGALALMVLGGIFALQLHSRDANNRPIPIVLPSNSSTQNSPGGGVNMPVSGNSLANGLTGLTQQPIIIHEPYPTPPRENSGPTYTVPSHNLTTTPKPHPDDTSGDLDNRGVRLNPDPDQSNDEGGKSESQSHASIVISQGQSSGPVILPDLPPNGVKTQDPPNAQSLIRMADDLKAKKQYKNAGDTYVKATENAGDDRAYAFEQAGWCFQNIGEKTTAISYYQHGKAEAQKLLAAGKQVDNARDMIRDCEVGIKVCSN